MNLVFEDIQRSTLYMYTILLEYMQKHVHLDTCIRVCVICLNPAGAWQRHVVHVSMLLVQTTLFPLITPCLSFPGISVLQCHCTGSSIESLSGYASRPGGCRSEWNTDWRETWFQKSYLVAQVRNHFCFVCTLFIAPGPHQS